MVVMSKPYSQSIKTDDLRPLVPWKGSIMHIPANITRAFGRFTMTAQKHAPTILTVVGVGSLVAATGFAINSTLHCGEVLEEHNEAIKAVERARYIADNDPDFKGRYPDDQEKMDRRVVAVRTVVNFGKLYWPTIALTTVGVASLLVGHNMMAKRTAAVTAALTAVAGKFDDYRKMVTDKYGAEIDSDFIKRIKEVAVVNEDGEVTEKTKRTQERDIHTGLDRFFDEFSPYWDTYNPQMNVAHLRAVQKTMQDQLAIRGHVLVNDVYDQLGIPRSPEGAVMGWYYDKDNPDTVVDLGIYKDTDDPWDFTIDEPWDGMNGIMLNLDGATIMYDKI